MRVMFLLDHLYLANNSVGNPAERGGHMTPDSLNEGEPTASYGPM